MAPAGGRLSPHDELPIYTSLTEVFGLTLWLMLKVGFIAATPVALGTVFYAVRPLLDHHQRRMLAFYMLAGVLFFIAGASFAYFALIPAGVRFLLNFGEGIAVPAIRISEYMSVTASMMWWLGVIFEIPLVMFGLAKLRLVTYGHFKKVRKFVPPSASIFGAILSPGFDIVTALLIAVPIVLLFEVGLLLAWLAQPGKGSLMLHWIKRIVVGILRRVAVVLILVPTLLVGLLYVTALSLMFVWDGHLSSGTASPGAARLERVYRRVRGVLAKVSLLRKGRAQAWTPHSEAAKIRMPD